MSKVNFMAVVALLAAIGTVAFKASDSTMQTTKWYTVSPDASDPQDDLIGSETLDPTQGGDCGDLQALRCTIQLTLPSPSYIPTGKTVSQVEDDGATIVDEKFEEE